MLDPKHYRKMSRSHGQQVIVDGEQEPDGESRQIPSAEPSPLRPL